MSYTVVSFQGSLQSFRSINEITHFTHYTIAHAHLGVYSFFTMVMFGSIYYMGPRLTGREWASARLMKVHFWATATGMAIYWVALTWGGIFEGLKLDNPDIAVLDVVGYTVPYLWSRSVAGALMATGHIAFAVLCWRMFTVRGGELKGPTLFVPRPDVTGGAP
jgi:cytochrome c oxidase cbb3-type subunit 1